jgi:hypothetical protein
MTDQARPTPPETLDKLAARLTKASAEAHIASRTLPPQGTFAELVMAWATLMSEAADALTPPPSAPTEPGRLQRLVNDLYALFTSTPEQIAARFGESRCRDDSARINYALEWLADVATPPPTATPTPETDPFPSANLGTMARGGWLPHEPEKE